MPLPFDPASLSATPPPPGNPMMGGGAPVITPPAAPNVQVQPPAPDPQQAAQAHDSLIGRTFKALTGTNTQYSVDPTTGKTIQTPVQNTPGQFFKNVVAAALLGGAMGEDKARQNEGSPLAAAVQGGTAVINRDQQLNQQRIGQARDEFQDQLKAQQNQREQSTADREAQEAPLRQQMLKAQTAQMNAATANQLAEAQSRGFTFHHEMADAGQAEAKMYEDSNVQPFARDIPESQIPEFLKNNPGAASQYHAVVTGTRTSLDKNGQPQWESTVSLYPNSASTVVTKDWLNTPKIQALKRTDPDWYSNLQQKAETGGTIDAQTRQATILRATAAYGEQTKANTDDLASKREQALIDEAKAHIGEYHAETAKLYKDQQQQDFANDSLAAVLRGDNGKDKKGIVQPVTAKQYASALPILRDSANLAHANWVTAISAAKDETDEKGPLHDEANKLGQEASDAASVVSGVVRRAGGNPEPGAATAGGSTQLRDPHGNMVEVPSGDVTKWLGKGYTQPGGGTNSDEQVTVKLGNTTQTMSRADFAANKAKWADIDPNVNPQAAAWKTAAVTGAAPAPPGPRTYVSPGSLY